MSFCEPFLFGFTSCLRSKIVLVLFLGERCNIVNILSLLISIACSHGVPKVLSITLTNY